MENTQKDWNEFKSNDSWSIFKIMSEFVEGYDRMSKIGPCVSIFGSARTKEENPYYQLGVEIADKLARAGYGIITGGGPGLMDPVRSHPLRSAMRQSAPVRSAWRVGSWWRGPARWPDRAERVRFLPAWRVIST